MKNKRQDNDDLFIDKLTQYKVKCSHCGHTMYLIRRDWCICDWCGYKVYRSKKDEFNDKLKQSLKSRH